MVKSSASGRSQESKKPAGAAAKSIQKRDRHANDIQRGMERSAKQKMRLLADTEAWRGEELAKADGPMSRAGGLYCRKLTAAGTTTSSSETRPRPLWRRSST